MSIVVDSTDLPRTLLETMDRDLEIRIEAGKKGLGRPRFVYPYSIVNDVFVTLPFGYAVRNHVARPARNEYTTVSTVEFTGEPREEQREILQEAMRSLNTTGSVLISLYTGGGKTFCAIYLAYKIRLKTLIMVHTLTLLKQWEQSIHAFCGSSAHVQICTTKDRCLDPACEFYIIYAPNVPKMHANAFRDIGLCICDEAHLIMAEVFAKALTKVFPRYLIGLTATPYRPDGLDCMLENYFGSHRIVRTLFRKHTVYKVRTGFTPPMEKTEQGMINWGRALEAQALDENRNELIVRILRHFRDKKWIVLVKRIAQAEYLTRRLRALGETVASFFGGTTTSSKNAPVVDDRTARIVIGTNQKIGVGYDNPLSNALLIAADIEQYFIQCLGRVFRSKEIDPIVVDLVDKGHIMAKHYETRLSTYLSSGGTIIEKGAHTFGRAE